MIINHKKNEKIVKLCHSLHSSRFLSCFSSVIVAALNIIFEKWGSFANQNQWNISGEPCSGAAIAYSIALDTDGYSPFIKCDCSYNKNTLCHIIGMSFHALEVDGVIPDELWSLNSLIELDFSVNRLSRQLPKELGMLFESQSLNIERNNFSGPLPSVLGKLTKLKDLAIGTNNFSSPLPSELSKLTKLKTLYMDSAGVSGEIPSSFANLKNLELL
ncbi:hypothetical protein Patl1_24203 [Pistacia atlantica]|uniref:Uncharacterized protein n=1 Tax=Pistacia atlantica TaxID=434234 RepID=A0ACC0ZYS5_9ROSI|nr:hypothetical protein Patl1_24203 [Pistacia atlantica]